MEDGHFTLYVFGRLAGLPRSRLPALVAAAGGRLAVKLSSRVNLIAVAHTTVSSGLEGAPPLALPARVPDAAIVISERNLKRMLGVAPKRPHETRDVTVGDLARVSGTTPDLIRCLLAAYDLFDPEDGRFGYRDLVAARELKRLLAEKVALSEVVRAAHVLLQSGKA
jgi:hypothetical protein